MLPPTRCLVLISSLMEPKLHESARAEAETLSFRFNISESSLSKITTHIIEQREIFNLHSYYNTANFVESQYIQLKKLKT